MKKAFEPDGHDQLNKLLGLGDTSIHKSYYPVLQQKIQALEAMELNLLAIFHNSYDAIIIHDATGRILDVNDRMLKIFHCEKSQALAWQVQEIIGNPVDRERLIQLWTEQTDGIYWEIETISRRPLDDSFFSSVTVLHRIVWNQADALMMVIRDTTEKRHQKIALEKALRELETMNENLEDIVKLRTKELADAQSELIRTEKLASLGALVAGVAHEINTPIGVSLTAASYLEDAIISASSREAGITSPAEQAKRLEKWRQTLKIILTNLNRAAKLIKSFKQVSVDQSSDLLRTFDLRDYINEVVESLLPTIKKSKHRIENQIAQGIVMHSYPGAISQIMTNLIQNALLHAFPPGESGMVAIQATEEAGEVEIIVRDNGMGISPEIINKIFDPFFTTKRNDGGTGLGLFIIHNLVRNQLQGRIECTTEVGGGTEFHIALKKVMIAEAIGPAKSSGASWSLSLVPERKIIRLVAAGLWTADDVVRAEMEIKKIAASFQGGGWAYLTNVARMDANINPQTSRALAGLHVVLAGISCRAMAFVVEEGMAIKAKAQRHQNLSGATELATGYFRTEEAALAWLKTMDI